MKLAPVSADLLIKLALVAAGIGLVIYGVRKAGQGINTLAGIPGRAYDSVVENVSAAGAAVADFPRRLVLGDAPTLADAANANTTDNPLVTPDGMNFGLF